MESTRTLGRVGQQILAELHAAAERLGADPKEIRRLPTRAVYDALEALGADRFLLGLVESWGDCMEDAEVLELLREWNRLGQFRFDEIRATTQRPPRRRHKRRGRHTNARR